MEISLSSFLARSRGRQGEEEERSRGLGKKADSIPFRISGLSLGVTPAVGAWIPIAPQKRVRAAEALQNVMRHLRFLAGLFPVWERNCHKHISSVKTSVRGDVTTFQRYEAELAVVPQHQAKHKSHPLASALALARICERLDSGGNLASQAGRATAPPEGRAPDTSCVKPFVDIKAEDILLSYRVERHVADGHICASPELRLNHSKGDPAFLIARFQFLHRNKAWAISPEEGHRQGGYPHPASWIVQNNDAAQGHYCAACSHPYSPAVADRAPFPLWRERSSSVRGGGSSPKTPRKCASK
eukprot:GHVU01233247.1.p1 GENE.GHVU01233247.1~~GHVU01233247.1.p1  ORF type:complete len:300 (+),score=17.99 GHVU01233247.1:172-1071(+)